MKTEMLSAPAFSNSPPQVQQAQAANESTLEHRASLALDQWRGLALVLVLVSHGFFFTNRVNGIGRVGVNLFFFISGILVFRSLERSRSRNDWDRTSRFWWRRARRLYPALFTYVIAMLIGTWFLQHRPGLPEYSDVASYLKAIPSALAYATNYAHAEPMALGHLWSLSCEMQFYLLAPLIFLTGERLGTNRAALYALLTGCLVGLGVLYPLLAKNLQEKYHFEFAVWPMMTGFFLESIKHRFGGIKRPIVKAIVLAGGLALALSSLLMLIGMETKMLVIALGAFLLLPCFLSYQYGLAWLGSVGRAFAWMGERTYSVYLWQQPLTICNFLPDFLHPVGALLSIAIGGVWFHLFELPFLSATRQKTVQSEHSKPSAKAGQNESTILPGQPARPRE